MKVYIGHDEREHGAAMVAARTLTEVTNGELRAEFLFADKLAAHGLLTRLEDRRGGQDYDLVSNAAKSTRFSISRFLVPMLCQEGFALFLDCDMVFYEDPRNMLKGLEGPKAVHVVKHDHRPVEQSKMCGLEQTAYPRKNWSSVMLFNCSHPSNRRLTLWDVNNRPGRDLHAFYWLGDNEIGGLDPRWNWLVGVQPKPEKVGIAHFTLGGPWFGDKWTPAEHDDMWLKAAGR
jgi:hypothetical protein